MAVPLRHRSTFLGSIERLGECISKNLNHKPMYALESEIFEFKVFDVFVKLQNLNFVSVFPGLIKWQHFLLLFSLKKGSNKLYAGYITKLYKVLGNITLSLTIIFHSKQLVLLGKMAEPFCPKVDFFAIK